jgi:hypothetical protein
MFMPQSNTPTRTLLEREKSRLHDKMSNSLVTLRDAVNAFHSLEDHYDLSEQTIESVDGWTYRIDKSLDDAGYLITELEDWAFDGDSYSLMEDAE